MNHIRKFIPYALVGGGTLAAICAWLLPRCARSQRAVPHATPLEDWESEGGNVLEPSSAPKPGPLADDGPAGR